MNDFSIFDTEPVPMDRHLIVKELVRTVECRHCYLKEDYGENGLGHFISYRSELAYNQYRDHKAFEALSFKEYESIIDAVSEYWHAGRGFDAYYWMRRPCSYP